MLNKAILIGRLTKDPEVKIAGEVPVCNFTLAVDRNFTSKEGEREADFIPVVVWRKLAENCGNFLSKGSLIAVEGRIQVRSYEKDDGERRWVTEVVGDNVRFLDGKKGNKE